jgi:flagellar M-ring protein FliF
MHDALVRLRELWENTSRTHQILLIAFTISAMVVGIGFVYWAGTPEYVTLVSNPSANDSAGIINLLKERKVLYRITDDGNIEVPAEHRAELRMALASAGLLNSGSLGYALLDRQGIAITSAIEQENIRRAIEGELQNSIQSLQPVASAHVQIAPAHEDPFVSQEKAQPSASVVVHLKPGQDLSKDNVKAIVNLVANSYTNLSPSRITLVDGEGHLRWDGANESGTGFGTEERHELERAFKEGLARDIKAQLRPVVGPDKYSLIVRATLDLDKHTEQQHEVLAGAPRVRESKSESLNGVGAAGGMRQPVGLAANATGAPTPNGPANPPVYGSPGAEVSGGNYKSEETSSNMENSTRDTHILKAPGEVKSLAVAVMVDKSVPPETVAAIEKNIQTIIGDNPSTLADNREVSVQTVAFDNTAQEAEKKTVEQAAAAERLNRLLSYGVPLVLMLAMLIILARSLRRALPRELALPGGAPMALAAAGAHGGGSSHPGGNVDLVVGGEGAEDLTDATTGAVEPKVIGLAPADRVHTFEVITEQFDANLESILHLAKSKPETVALLLKSWIAEETH